MLVDAHHHLWQVARADYGWLDSRVNPSIASIERDYLVADYQSLATRHAIRASVVVQAAPTVAETRWLLAQARASHGLIQGVVGWIDMAAADAPQVLHDLAQDPLLKSIRPMLQDIAPDDWVLRPELAPAFDAIIEHDLAFDLLIRPPQLEAALTLLQRYPELRAVVDHCAKPGIARQEWQPWAEQILRIASETTAHCKLSGLVTEAAVGWHAADLRSYMEHVLQCFGAQRIMWGSDWPVMTLNATFDSWLDAALQFLAPCSAAEREAIMGDNAQRFYRLNALGPS